MTVQIEQPSELPEPMVGLKPDLEPVGIKPPPKRKWHHHPVIRVPRRVLSSILLAVSFAVPVYLFVEAGKATLPDRITPARVVNPPIIPVRDYHDAVPVLVYHDVADRPGRFTISLKHFGMQMAALHRAGFHTVSVAQLIAFFHGGSLPSRPILLTFDDGLGSVWRDADPIMAQYGFRGVSYVISGQLGRHGFYYLHPAELRAMIRSGRWDVEAHTQMSHNFVPVGGGKWAPALANRMWLPRLGRLETEDEYTYRIVSDLTQNVRALRNYGANPLTFAYPFSAVGVPSNDAHLFTILSQIVSQRFGMSFVDSAGQRFISRYDSSDSQQLPRLEVYHDTTARNLLTRLNLLAPIPVRLHGFPATGWFDGAGKWGIPTPVQNGVLTVNCPGHQWCATVWAPSPSQLWHNYRVRVTVGHLGTENSGASGTLLTGDYAVSVSSGRLSIERQGHRLVYVRVPVNATHHLDVALGDRALRASVDGRVHTVLNNSQEHGGIGFGAWLGKSTSPIPVFSNLSVESLDG